MPENESPNRQGLPPRDHSADVPEHTDSTTVWMGGVIAAFAVLGLLLFGATRVADTTANSGLNTEPGTTTGAAPSKRAP